METQKCNMNRNSQSKTEDDRRVLRELSTVPIRRRLITSDGQKERYSTPRVTITDALRHAGVMPTDNVEDYSGSSKTADNAYVRFQPTKYDTLGVVPASLFFHPEKLPDGRSSTLWRSVKKAGNKSSKPNKSGTESLTLTIPTEVLEKLDIYLDDCDDGIIGYINVFSGDGMIAFSGLDQQEVVFHSNIEEQTVSENPYTVEDFQTAPIRLREYEKKDVPRITATQALRHTGVTEDVAGGSYIKFDIDSVDENNGIIPGLVVTDSDMAVDGRSDSLWRSIKIAGNKMSDKIKGDGSQALTISLPNEVVDTLSIDLDEYSEEAPSRVRVWAGDGNGVIGISSMDMIELPDFDTEDVIEKLPPEVKSDYKSVKESGKPVSEVASERDICEDDVRKNLYRAKMLLGNDY